MNPTYGWLVVILLASVAVLGDYCLKLASLETNFVYTRWFWAGSIIYAISAFGWVYAMQTVKLATIGVIFSLVTIFLLAGIGVFAFGESLNRYEMLGLALSIISMILLSRFS
jgi:small multidrug resistance pump